MYDNLVFDLGGVVIDYSPKDWLVDKFYHEATENKIYNAVFGSEEWVLLDEGKISWGEAQEIFLRRGKEKGIAFEMRAVLDEWTDMLTTRTATVTLLRLLKKKGFALYYLSNMSQYVYDFLQPRDFWELFDGGLISYDVGIVKPELDIYKRLLKEYSLVPQDTIFTDDDKDNAAAAFKAGVTGIQFKNVKSFCKMLVTYGIDI
ncbi:MAG: HAD-IA family hydrolase [Ruminococcaceae bacterium]|nr:HAD-IA family hydrolase [Oscillospiraceae bacterium]